MTTYKNEADTRAAANQQAWQTVCAKLGQPDAMYARAGGTVEQCHETRKAVRRAVNALTVSTANRDVTAEEAAAFDHAAQLVARLNSFIEDLGDGNSKAKADQLQPLRNKADFEAHYTKVHAAKGGSPHEDFSIADFLRGVANMASTPAVRAALSEGTDSAGGFTVPSILMPGVLSALAPASSLMQAGAGIVPLRDGGKSYTWAAVNTIPTAAWRLESGAVAESDPAFRAVVAAPKSLSFRFRLSRELLADGQNLTTALFQAIGQAFAREMDRAGLRGSGTNPEPRGLLNTSGIQTVGNGTNGTALAGYANFNSAVQALLSADAPMPTAAIMAPRSLVKLSGLVDSTGQPLRAPKMLETLPMIATSQIPVNLTVGTSTDCSEIYIGDFSKIIFALREAPSIQVLNELHAATGEIGFACHARVDVGVLYPAAFAVVTGVRA